MNTILESPVLLSSIMGADSDELAVECCEFGAAGTYPIGSVMAKDTAGKVVMATDALVASLYGILLNGRTVTDLPDDGGSAAVARQGSFKAQMLTVADGASLAGMAPRLREQGIYLEGLAAAGAPPFRIRSIAPTGVPTGATPVTLTVTGDGAFSATSVVWYDGVAATTTFKSYALLEVSITPAAPAGPKTVQVKDGTLLSNTVILTVT